MIEIGFNADKLELSITGHAEYAEKGKDIVCSAVSALFYTLAQCLGESTGMLKDKPRIIDSEKKAIKKISCSPQDKYRKNVELVYWTILTGLEVMANNYPDNVKWTK